MRTKGRSTSPRSLPSSVELAFEQEAGVGGQQLRNADRGGVRPVHRPERVLDEDVVAVGELLREPRVVLRLARVEARVLEHVKTLVGQELLQAFCNGAQRECGVVSLGPSEMRANRHLPGIPLEEQLQRRQRCQDSRFIRNAPVVERDVEVGADEHSLAAHVGIAYRPRPVHLCGDCRRDVGRDLRHDVDEPAAVAPLVVVPAEHLGHCSVRHRQIAVDDAGIR